MATESDARKTRRASRGTPRESQAQSFRDDERRDASSSRRPQLQSPANAVHMGDSFGGSKPRVSHSPIESGTRPRKDSLVVARQQKAASPISSKPTPTHRALQTVATADSQDHISLSDGDMPPAHGGSHRKGQKSPAASGTDDRKGRRASHTDVRTPSAPKPRTRDGVGLGLSIRHPQKPNSRTPSSMQLHDDKSQAIPSSRISKSPSATSRPKWSEDDPFAFDNMESGLSATGNTPLNALSDSFISDRPMTPQATRPGSRPHSRSNDRLESKSRVYSGEDLDTRGRIVPAESTNQRVGGTPKAPRRVPVPHVNDLHTQQPAETSPVLTKRNAESIDAIVATPKTTQSPRIVLRLHEPPTEPTPNSARSIQRSPRPKSTRDTTSSVSPASRHSRRNTPAETENGLSDQNRRLRAQPSPSWAPSVDGNTSTHKVSLHSLDEAISSGEGRRGKRTTASSADLPPSDNFMEGGEQQTDTPAYSRSPYNTASPSVTSVEHNIARRHASNDSWILGDTQPRPRRDRSASRTVANPPQATYSNVVSQSPAKSLKSPSTRSPAPNAPSRKNSQEQRMDALMSGLGIASNDASNSRPASRAGEYDRETRTPTLDRESSHENEPKRQSSSAFLRRSIDKIPGHSTPTACRSSSPFPGSSRPGTPVRSKSPGPQLQDWHGSGMIRTHSMSGTSDEDDESTLWTPVDGIYDGDHILSREDESQPLYRDGPSHPISSTLSNMVHPKSVHDASRFVSDISPSDSLDQSAWRAISTDSQLSTGAEALFKTLQSPAHGSHAPCPRVPLGDTDRQGRSATIDSSPAGDDCSEFSVQGVRYVESEADDEDSVPESDHHLKTWRSTLAPAAFESLLERHGAQEMQRQEVIWEICESEHSFVRELRNILRMFVQPLRTQDRQWISGIPATVMRLFDWLDDILQLHSQVFSALHAARSKQYPVVIHVAEILRPFIPRLELHQPYLARLSWVSQVIDTHVDDHKSDFGEYVRMQMRLPEWSGKTLTTALRRPITQVTGYPSQFRKLWQLTPRSHLDHLPTFSLYHSTDMIVRVMLEVCSREEEHETVKDISSRISGLPHHFVLATRERRLVAQGLLRHVQLSDRERMILEGQDTNPSDVPEIPLCAPIISPQYHNIRSWDSSFNWSGLNTSSSSQDSRNASRATSTAPSSSSSSASFSSESEDDPSRLNPSRQGSSSRSHKGRLKDALVYVFVFTDLILLTHKTNAHDENERDTWQLVEEVGMARVLGVADHSGKIDYDQLLCLDVLPMPQERGGVNIAPKHCVVSSVYLSLSERATGRSMSSRLLEQAKQQWAQALYKCFTFTLRSLSFPSQNGIDIAHGPTTDYDMDTSLSIMSILSSGLPLPKSPSLLLDEHGQGRPPDAVEEEREERGWWALRFRQVLREVQRQDLPLPNDQSRSEDTLRATQRFRTPSGSAVDNRRRSVVANPRPLLLSTGSNSISLTPATPSRK